MSAIEVKKAELTATREFLSKLEISGGKLNRSRYRLNELINAKERELEEERHTLATQYAFTDSKGELASNPDGTIRFRSAEMMQQFQADYGETLQENTVINIDEYQSEIQSMYDFLIDYDSALSGNDGVVYGRLLDAMENAGIKAKESE